MVRARDEKRGKHARAVMKTNVEENRSRGGPKDLRWSIVRTYCARRGDFETKWKSRTKGGGPEIVGSKTYEKAEKEVQPIL